MMVALTHGLEILFLLAVFCATGSLIAAASRIPVPPVLGRFLVHTTLGLIAWMYGSFVLACLGLYRPAVLISVAAGLLLVALPLAFVKWRHAEIHPQRNRQLLLTLLALSPVAVVLLAGFVNALPPTLGWDDDVYHLTLPKLYLAHGGFRPIEFSVYSHWPHAIELVYGLALALADQVLAKLVHVLLLGLVIVAVYRLCRQRVSRVMAVTAGLLVLGNDVMLFETPVAYVDIGFAFLFLMAVAFADEYLRSDRMPHLVLAGVCAGAAAGSKLSGFVVPVCIVTMVWLSHPNLVDRARRVRIAMAVLLPSLLMALPWYVKTWVYTGNPVYPFFFAQLGGIEWSADLGHDFTHWQRSLGMGRSLQDYLALPYRVIMSGARGYSRFDAGFGKFWLVAAPLAMFGACFDRSIRSYVLCAVFYFGFWAASSQQGRFLIAILPLLAIAATFTADRAISKLPLVLREGLAAFLGVAVIALSLPVIIPFCRDAVATVQHLWREGSEDPGTAVPEGYAYLNTHAPPDAKVMLLNINEGYFLERDYIADSFFEASQMNWLLKQAHNEEELSRLFALRGITHLYIDSKNWRIPYPPWIASYLRNPDRVEREYTCGNGSCAIYRIRPSARAR